jgi:hypothetical protein
MGIQKRTMGRGGIAAAAVLAALATAGPALAFQPLPPGAQVNDDPAAGINPALSVATEDPTNADVVGGSLTGGKAVPWAIFQQQEQGAPDQVFVRSFANGAWTTRGNGTVGGSSSATPTFSGSLNFDQTQDGEVPSIDFAGAGRTVPWAAWYEHTTGGNFGADNIFASKFDNTGDANQGRWIFAGQGRGTGGQNNVPVPSLNIHTNRDAVNPVVQGGATVAGNAPVPWVTWQEEDGNPNTNQIFVSKAVKPASGTTCPNDGLNPIKPPAGTGAEGGFCFQQVGIDRLAPDAGALPATTSDPTLNVDPSRDGIEPDMAFTGPNDTVPWVVWYEQNNSGVGLHNNEMVFAAKATANPSADGQFQWTAVGINDAEVLDTQGTTPSGGLHFGNCAVSQSAEANCSINKDPNADAEDPRVAAGTMTPGNATVPWVVWDEGSAASPNDNNVFVARLVGTGAAARFVIANGGQPVGTGDRADITFSGNTPYVTWHHNNQVVTGHFATPDSFIKDGAPVGTNTPDAVRAPISSGCIANPFNQDGANCQGSAVGTPFFLFTDGDGASAKLFATAYQPDPPVTLGPTGVGTGTGTLNGSVNPEGAAINASFQFGPTTSYGSTTPALKTAVSSSPVGFSANLTGLTPGTTIHYRAVAVSDFGTFVGADQTLTTATPAPPPAQPGRASAGHAHVSGKTAAVAITCKGATSCRVALKLSVVETFKGHKLVGVTAARKQRVTRKVVVLGTATATVAAGRTTTVRVALNGKGRGLLALRHRLTATLEVTQSAGGHNSLVSRQKVTFTSPKPKHGHKGH